MLEPERLILRKFELNDAKIVQELAGDYEIARTTLHIPHPYPDGAAEAWIESLNSAEHEGKIHTFAIVRKNDDVLMGAIRLGVVKSHNRAELGYWLGKPYWGSGYTTEAARRVMQYDYKDLEELLADGFLEYGSSGNVFTKQDQLDAVRNRATPFCEV
jgi:[ribosomal protein S5]-alanine N-acetyltransferase